MTEVWGGVCTVQKVGRGSPTSPSEVSTSKDKMQRVCKDYEDRATAGIFRKRAPLYVPIPALYNSQRESDWDLKKNKKQVRHWYISPESCHILVKLNETPLNLNRFLTTSKPVEGGLCCCNTSFPYPLRIVNSMLSLLCQYASHPNRNAHTHTDTRSLLSFIQRKKKYMHTLFAYI